MLILTFTVVLYRTWYRTFVYRVYRQIFTFGIFGVRGEAEKEEKEKEKMKEKRKKRKKKEDFLNDECEELTYPFLLLFEFSVDWTWSLKAVSSSNISVHDAITYLIYQTAASHMTFSEALALSHSMVV